MDELRLFSKVYLSWSRMAQQMILLHCHHVQPEPIRIHIFYLHRERHQLLGSGKPGICRKEIFFVSLFLNKHKSWSLYTLYSISYYQY